jgi:zinc protease
LRSDLNAFTSWRDSLRAEIDSKGNKASHGLSREDLDVVNYDLVMQLAAQRFSNVGDFTFVITGNVSEAELMPLLNKYIATLHTNGKYEVPNYDATSNSLRKR